ncbi:hypothetical protein PO909_017389 [Leuciscus waleckii]
MFLGSWFLIPPPQTLSLGISIIQSFPNPQRPRHQCSSEEFVETGPCGRILLVYNLLPLIKISPFKVQSALVQPAQQTSQASRHA